MNYNKKTVKLREKKLESKKARKKQSAKTNVFYVAVSVFLFCIALIGGLGLGVFQGIIASAPDADKINIEPTGFITTIYDSDGNVIEQLSDYTSHRIKVTYEQLPENLRDAFIAIEDVRFYEHKGIDIKGMVRALFVNIASGGISEGASTITQQLIKNNVFDVGAGETTVYAKLERKIQEQYLALQVEKEYSKEEILTHYLNSINLGQGTLGVQAAANAYFDKDVSELNLAECAVLASITKSPTYYNPVDYPDANKERRDRVLSNMLAAEMITTEEYNEAIADNVYERIQQVSDKNEDDGIYSYFVDAVIKQILTDLQAEEYGYTQTQIYKMLYSGGLSIYTTQDTEIQNIVDSVINDEDNYPSTSGYSLTYRLSLLKEDGSTVNYSEYDVVAYMKNNGNKDARLIYSSKAKAEEDVAKFRASVVEATDKVTGESFNLVIQPQASATIIDQATGEVKALAGGRGEKTSNLSLNRATGATRQPGSTFKVLAAFLPALDTKGNTLATVHDDAPYNYAGTDDAVHNYYRTYYRGFCTIREAITHSLNIITAKTMEDVTPQVGYDYLTKLGFTTLVEHRVDADGDVHSDIVQPLALGGITDGITNLELTAAYAAIANQGVYVEPKLYTKIVDHDGNVLYENVSEENRVMKESTSWLLTNAMKDVLTKGTATAARLSTGMPAAGKTGTTTGNVDFWFSGYTPYYTGSVWMGYDINTTFSGSNYPKTMWKKIMDKIVREKGLSYKDFPSCDNIVTRKICTESGLLAVEGVCDSVTDNKCVVSEYFEKGTQPTEKCSIHTKITVCKLSGLPAGQYCPDTEKEEKVYLIKEEDYNVETWDTPYILPENFQEKVCDKHDELSWIKDVLNSTTGEEPVTTPVTPGTSASPGR